MGGYVGVDFGGQRLQVGVRDGCAGDRDRDSEFEWRQGVVRDRRVGGRLADELDDNGGPVGTVVERAYRDPNSDDKVEEMVLDMDCARAAA
jgi:hypothetical protein